LEEMLSHEEKLAICRELEELGLVRRDEADRFWLTARGNRIGMALCNKGGWQ
jgi:Mn-dependent DtxR family transcriptional regulator